LGLTPGKGLPVWSLGLEVQVVHMDIDMLMPVMATDEGIFLGGGVMLWGCAAKHDLLHILQPDNMSLPLSINPFNLIPYLNTYKQLIHHEMCMLLTWLQHPWVWSWCAATHAWQWCKSQRWHCTVWLGSPYGRLQW
jgi:hypothetical protein